MLACPRVVRSRERDSVTIGLRGHRLNKNENKTTKGNNSVCGAVMQGTSSSNVADYDDLQSARPCNNENK